MSGIADRIRSARLGAGMTQEQLAHELGVVVRSVAAWESGEHEPRGLARQALEKWLSA